MQVAQNGEMVNIELQNRLNVGGRWYGRATVVAVDSADAEILKSRGFAVDAKRGAKPVNVEVKEPETIAPQNIPVVTKDAVEEQLPAKDVPAESPSVPLKKEENGNGKRSANRR